MSRLSLSGVQGGYGASRVLFGVSFEVGEGEVVALLGRNGMGKTTTVRTIMGLLPATAGTIAYGAVSLRGLPPFGVARAGLGLVPEGRQIFPTLTVAENLIATARRGGWTVPKVFALFPRLAERSGNLGRNLSGGEQQMLAIGRALMTNPRVLILDEATEGLAPLIRREIWHTIAQLKGAGLGILLIDKTLDAMLRLADRHVLIEKGSTVWTGTSAELRAAPALLERYLHV